jgi:WD40 repeat protein
MQTTAADPAKTHMVKDWAHTGPLISCAFDPAGKWVFAGAQDSKIWRFDFENGNKTELAGHESWVRAMAFANGGQTLITGGYDGRLIWWPVAAEKPAPIRAIEAHQGWIRAMATSPDGATLASVGNDLVVRLWNASDGAPIRELAGGHERHIYNVAFHPIDKHLVTGDLMGKFVDWDLPAGKEARRLTIPVLSKYDPTFLADIGGPRGLKFSADGSQLAASGITNVSNAFAGIGTVCVVLVNWADGKEIVQYASKAEVKGVAWNVAFHPTGFLVAATGGQGGGHLFFWKGMEKHEFHTLKLPNVARDLALGPDQSHLATPHYDGHLRVWRMTDKR